MRNIYLVNKTTSVTTAQLNAIVAAINVQIQQHFSPYWVHVANVVAVPYGQTQPALSWYLEILNQAPAIYGVTPSVQSDGTLESIYLTGYVSVAACTQQNKPVSQICSKAILEMLMKLGMNLAVLRSDTSGNVLAVELTVFMNDGYSIAGTIVNNFVTPYFFTPGAKPSWATYDWNNTVAAPFTGVAGSGSSFVVTTLPPSYEIQP